MQLVLHCPHTLPLPVLSMPLYWGTDNCDFNVVLPPVFGLNKHSPVKQQPSSVYLYVWGVGESKDTIAGLQTGQTHSMLGNARGTLGGGVLLPLMP